jgi:peptidoglycan/xylan/chitin deacetylase (PgdA/CDA1 family)
VAKKELLAQGLEKTGILNLLEALPNRSQLIALNYHRIGTATESQYDPNVFSEDAQGFDQHLRILKKKFNVVSPDEALSYINGSEKPQGTCVLVTFDDGYRDCVDVALPIMKKHGVRGVFFVVSQYAEKQPVPWWDEVARLVKAAEGKKITLTYPHELHLEFSAASQLKNIKILLNLYKNPETKDTDFFLQNLSSCIGLPLKNFDQKLLLGWDDAKLMQKAGMEIGLHSNSHAVMSKLSKNQQFDDIVAGKSLMTERLGKAPRMFAYPDGRQSSFTNETMQVVKDLGFEAAFSFYGGCNPSPSSHPFNVLRTSIEPYSSQARIRLSTTLSAITARSNL